MSCSSMMRMKIVLPPNEPTVEPEPRPKRFAAVESEMDLDMLADE